MNEATLIPDKVIDRRTPLCLAELKSFIKDALKALCYLHQHQIIHADLKLENMLCYKKDNQIKLKLCDFGIAMRMEEGACLMKEFSGTLGYNAPEISKGAKVTEKVDIWSLGICIYEMAVAYKPSVLNKNLLKDGLVQFRERDWKGLDQV